MRTGKTRQNRKVYTCEIPAAVLGSLESLLAYSMKAERPKFETATEDDNLSHILNDLKAVENWYFKSNFARKPSRWLGIVCQLIVVALMAYVTFDLLTLRFDEAVCFFTAVGFER